MPAMLSVVIHGHFYQPPREDPWLETLEAQPSAAPFHDWNEKIERECYRAVSAARLTGREGRIAEIVNTLESISFNFGPTLLEWMEDHAPRTYRAIMDADASSRMKHRGHGNALAQAYHHTILPLASRREKVSEVRWGIADFSRRFGRDPIGMWLPETAVDRETLEVLAEEGMVFTILAPHQVKRVPEQGLPGRFSASRGRSLAVFVYDGALSHDLAFGSLSRDASEWERRIIHGSGEPRDRGRRLVSIATDGETYGHHHRFGEMGLAAVLRNLEQRPEVQIENFSSFLERNPPQQEIEIVDPSSWSCVHGIDRWRSDCGCKMEPSRDTQQRWRVGLRDAMDWLAERIHEVFEREGPPLLGDPWTARDLYGRVAAAPPGEGLRLLSELAPRALEPEERTRAMELLEMERNALRIFTSCGWFFDDLAGIEPRQVLRYAARAMELAGDSESLEEGLVRRLDAASSNEDPPRSGGAIFLEDARPPIPAPLRVAAGMAAWEAVEASLPDRRGPRRDVRSGPGSVPSIQPGTPGFQVSRVEEGVLRVGHRRIGRDWLVECRVSMPAPTRIEVAARAWGAATPFLPVQLADLPEAYRLPIVRALVKSARGMFSAEDLGTAPASEPETTPHALRQALVGAIRALGSEPRAGRPTPDVVVEMVRDLVGLHRLLELPIPFDAQTDYYRLLGDLPASVTNRLSILREPLGFEPRS